MIPESMLQKVLDHVSMVDIVSSYMVLENRGGRYWGCCPFHNEKTPSFSVTEDKKLYYCFGCQKGGSLFNFVMEIEGVPFIDAVKIVAEKAGIDIDYQNTRDDREYRDKQALIQLYARVAKSFEYILHETTEGHNALHYLEKRGISIDTIRKFGLGYAPSNRRWLLGFLKEKGYSAEFLSKSGLFSYRKPDYPLYAGRIMIPIRSLRGEIIAFGGRILEGDGPKYINSPDTPLYTKRKTLYALSESSQEIRKSRNFIICEGYLDVLAFHQAGIPRAVAPLGTALTSEQMRLLKRYSNNGFLVFDRDDAGINATFKSLVLGEQVGVRLQVIPLSGGKDPAEIIEKEGRDALHKLLKYPINSFDYLLDTSLGNVEKSTPEEKENAVKKLLPYINVIDSSIRREEYKKALSERLNIPVDVIGDEIRKNTQNIHTQSSGSAKPEQPEFNANSPEIYMLMGVLCKPELFKEVRKVLSIDDISSPLGKKIYIALEECFRREDLSLDNLLEQIDDDKAKPVIMQKIASGEFAHQTENIVRDAIVKVRIEAISAKRSRIEKKLSGKMDYESLRELLSEKMYLDGELDKLRLRRNDRSY